MKAIWSGTISFGLVNIPVSLMGAEESDQLSFKLMDSRDHGKIKYQRINVETGEEVPWNEIVKYYEFEDGSYVTVTDEDFEKADPKAAKSVEMESFIDLEKLNPMFIEKPYFIVPKKGGEKAYILLRDAMNKTGHIGIGRVTIRTRQSLCAIMPHEEGLILIMLRFADELRDTGQLKLPEKMKTSQKELDLAVTLIESLKAEWDPDNYKDTYAEALMKRINAKAKSKDGHLAEDSPPQEESSSKVVDLMDLLKQSVESKAKKTGKRSKSS